MSRNYRGDVELSQIEKFMPLLVEKEDEGKISPILQNGNTSYIYIKHMNIFRKRFQILLTQLHNLIFSCLTIKEKRQCSSYAFIPIQMCGSFFKLF